jgi:hypothetical protein
MIRETRRPGLGILVPRTKQAFAIETPPDLPRLHTLALYCGARGMGKGVACYTLLKHYKAAGVCDRVLVISPTAQQNRELFEDLGVDFDHDVFTEPTVGSLNEVLRIVEKEGRDWERYELELKAYEAMQRFLKGGKRSKVKLEDIPPELVLAVDRADLWDAPPQSKYGHKPVIHVVLDDCFGSPIFNVSSKSPLVHLAIRHRHVGGIRLSLHLLVQALTGATGGIGWAIAQTLHAQGANVAISGTRAERLDAVFFLDLPGGNERTAIWQMYRESKMVSQIKSSTCN